MSKITDADSLLIVLNPKLGLLEVLLVTSIVNNLRPHKVTHIATNPNYFEKYKTLLGWNNSEKSQIIPKLTPRKYVLSFPKGDINVKNIQWHQTETEISLYVTTVQGAFKPEGMDFKTEGNTYDHILYLNVDSFESLNHIFEPVKNAVNEAHNMSLGKPLAIPHREVEIIGQNETNSYVIFEAVKQAGQLNNQSGLILAAAAVIETGSFNKNNITGNTFRMMADIIDLGVSYQAINELTQKLRELAKTADKPTTEEANKPTEPKTESTEAKMN